MVVPFSLIVAATKNLGIGQKGKLPWRLKKDMDFFKSITSITQDPKKMNCCIMGRKTYFSIPQKFRPLQQRINIVLSRNPSKDLQSEVGEQVFICSSLEEALEYISNRLRDVVESVFVIGGSEVYSEAIQNQSCKSILFTLIHNEFECDTFFPPINNSIYSLTKPEQEIQLNEENGIYFQFLKYERTSPTINTL